MSKRTEKDSLYNKIHNHALNKDMTLEEMGIKYGITKARVWQIVRFNQLGKGDYYTGYKAYMDKKSEIDGTPKLTSKERSNLLRSWLNNRDIRLIKSKYDTSTVG
tara:strand:- start:388 stop:702 length:315 start_codon:yes stop_codon:yes gene_type:complete